MVPLRVSHCPCKFKVGMIRHMITMPHPPDHKESENWSGNGDKGELPGNTCVHPKYIEVILKSKTAKERLEVEARSVIYKWSREAFTHLHSTSLRRLLFSCPLVGVSTKQTLPCFSTEIWWTTRNFRLKLRMRRKNCRMRISGGKTGAPGESNDVKELMALPRAKTY